MTKYILSLFLLSFIHQYSHAQISPFGYEQERKIYSKNKVKKITAVFYTKIENSEDWKESEKDNDIFEYNNFGYKTRQNNVQYKYLNDTILVERWSKNNQKEKSIFTYKGNVRKETYNQFGKRISNYIYRDQLHRDTLHTLYDGQNLVLTTHTVYDSVGVLSESQNFREYVYSTIRVDESPYIHAFYRCSKDGRRIKLVDKTYNEVGQLIMEERKNSFVPIVHLSQDKTTYIKYLDNDLIDEVIYDISYSGDANRYIMKHKLIYEFYDYDNKSVIPTASN